MLYLISGTSRGGKTIVSKKIFADLKIPYLSLDWLVMGFTNGIPEYGINDKLFPDEIAKKMWNFTKAMCENMIWVGNDYIIEGEAILPEHADELLKKYPDKVKVCYLGYADIDIIKKVDDVKKFSVGTNDWLCNESDEFIYKHINNMVTYSIMIRNECEKYKVKYFDTSNNFIKAIDLAVKYLTEK